MQMYRTEQAWRTRERLLLQMERALELAAIHHHSSASLPLNSNVSSKTCCLQKQQDESWCAEAGDHL